MARQATLKNDELGAGQNGSSPGSTQNVAGNMVDVLHDMSALLELQARLFVLDARAAGRRCILPIILSLIGLTLLAGGTVVGLIALAETIAAQTDFSHGAALSSVAAGGVVVAILLLGVAWSRLRAGGRELERSQEELSRNIRWVKAVIRSRGNVQGR
jgi:hypothetical protein